MNNKFIIGCVLITMVLGSSSFTLYMSNGWEWRIPIERQARSSKQHRADESSYCINEKVNENFITCQVYRGGDRNIYIWGDSHARHLVAGFSEYYKDYNIFILYESGCFPQSGLGGYIQKFIGRKKQESSCVQRNRNVFDYFKTIEPTNIILTAYLLKGISSKIAQPTKSIVETLERYGHNIFFLANVIPPFKPLVDCYNVPRYIVSDIQIEQRCKGVKRKILDLRGEYRVMEDMLGGKFFNTDMILCEDGQCKTFVNGKPLFRDKSHLTIFGSKYFVEKLKNSLKLKLI